MKTRREKDALGTVEVPTESYGGSFYVRAKKNFQISNVQATPSFGTAFGLVKIAAAKVNGELGLLEKKKSVVIQKAGEEFLERKFPEFYELDMYQAGAGTPLNMTLNEVLANRANELLGGKKGEYKWVHPNDHVNLGQSSNDVTPTALRLAVLMDLENLWKIEKQLGESFLKKSREFSKVLKTGRTHLQDAVPVTLGQEFGAYASALNNARNRILVAKAELKQLGIGGTAIGSGINCHPQFAKKMVKELGKLSGLNGLKVAENKFETTHSMAAFLTTSSVLRSLAVELIRICNDLRLMASGPVAGFNEIALPEVEPGSSIMPGKVNPSVLESMLMICTQVIALDTGICLAAQKGELELNWYTPLIAIDLLHQIEILTSGMEMLRKDCIEGLKAHEKEMRAVLESSCAMATALAPKLGYRKVAEMVNQAKKAGKPFSTLL